MFYIYVSIQAHMYIDIFIPIFQMHIHPRFTKETNLKLKDPEEIPGKLLTLPFSLRI